VFSEWKEDDGEVLGQLFKHDWSHMLIKRLVDEEDQIRKIKNELLSNIYMIKEIYH